MKKQKTKFLHPGMNKMPTFNTERDLYRSQKRILILIGRGKSTLTTFIEQVAGHDMAQVGLFTIDDPLKWDAKKKRDIKSETECGMYYFIHLNSEDMLKTVPLAIRRRALVFYIDIPKI